MFKDAKWIQGDMQCESPLFRREFTVNHPVSSTIRICGLGFFELYLNGQKISDDLLVPAWSNYEQRPDRRMLYPTKDMFANRTYYLEYDLTPYIKNEFNVIGVWLGNGWYNQHERNVEGDFAYGFPKLCFIVQWEEIDGSKKEIISDEMVKWRESNIIFNNIYYGETHDLSIKLDGWNELEYSGPDWKNVNIATSPDTNFERQNCPADKVIRSIQPDLILNTESRKVYDCRENITGYAVVRCGTPAGEEVIVTYSEEYDHCTHMLDYNSAGGIEQVQTDRYLCGINELLCHPKFCWHGFRYFEVIGNAAVAAEVKVVHGDIPVTSTFESSCATLNWLYDAYIRSQLGNIHCGVPSDCPHRERLGYTGDGQLTSQAAMFCLDVRSLYEKWMGDIIDSQDQRTGHVQHTAPFYGGGGGPGGWGGAVYIIPWNYYRHYGDASLIKKYLSNILLWFDYMDSRAPDGLIIREEDGGWCLGEWCAFKQEIPECFVNTYFYIKGLQIILKISKSLQLKINQELFEKRLHKAINALVSTYFSQETGSFCEGVNGADAFAVDLNLGDERTLFALLERYRTMEKLDTGIFGTDLLIDILFRHDPDLAYRLLTVDSDSSFEHMRRQGATTIWETWDGKASHNHPMFGSVVRSLFTHILGIRQQEDSAGFSSITVEPALITGLDWVRGSIQTPSGKICVEICRCNDGSISIKSDVLP